MGAKNGVSEQTILDGFHEYGGVAQVKRAFEVGDQLERYAQQVPLPQAIGVVGASPSVLSFMNCMIYCSLSRPNRLPERRVIKATLIDDLAIRIWRDDSVHINIFAFDFVNKEG